MPPLSCSSVEQAETLVYGKSVWVDDRKSLSLSCSSMFLFSHLRVSALQCLPASEMAIASGVYCLVTARMARIFSALVMPPWMLSVCMQKLPPVLEPPCVEYTVEGPMSASAHWLRAMYLAQAVATRVDSVPAAAIVEPASEEAWAVGSREIPMSAIEPGVVGSNARAGVVSWR